MIQDFQYFSLRNLKFFFNFYFNNSFNFLSLLFLFSIINNYLSNVNVERGNCILDYISSNNAFILSYWISKETNLNNAKRCISFFILNIYSCFIYNYVSNNIYNILENNIFNIRDKRIRNKNFFYKRINLNRP